MRYWLLLLIFLFIPFPAQATLLTVCSNACTGTVVATVFNSAAAGDTVEVRADSPGASKSIACGSLTANGSAGNYITLQARSGDAITLTSNCALAAHVYISITGFIFNNTTITGTNCNHIKIISNSFDNWGIGVGISMGCDNVLVDSNSFGPNVNDDDINIFGWYWVIRNNEAKGITQTTQHPDFIQTYCTGREPNSYLLVENNYAHDCTGADCHFMQFNNLSCDLSNASNGSLGMTVWIFRENRTKHIQSYFVGYQNQQNLTMSGDNYTRIAVYNNTIGDQDNNHQVSDNQVNQLDPTPGFEKNDITYNSMDYLVSIGLMFPTSQTFKNTLAFFSGQTFTTRTPFSTCVSSGGCKVNVDPLLNNFSTGDFTLQNGSPAIDAGTSITTVGASDTGSGTTLIVNDAYAFQDATWVDGINADCIAVKTVTNNVCITAINYQTNTITLGTDPGSRASGDPVWLYSNSAGLRVLYGTAPDMGALETGGTTPSNAGKPLLNIIRNDGIFALALPFLFLGVKFRGKR